MRLRKNDKGTDEFSAIKQTNEPPANNTEQSPPPDAGEPRKTRRTSRASTIFAIIFILAAGALAVLVYQNSKNDELSSGTPQSAECAYDDDELCKFFATYKTRDSFTVTSVTESDNETVNMTLTTDGDKSHLKMEGDTPYEVISIGQTSYTKAADGTWWKQTAENNIAANLQDEVTIELREPTNVDSAESITYERQEKEACGDLNCFKYKMTDPADPGSTAYIWFDDQEHQLRRIQIEREGGISDSTFNYEVVSITEPAPVKDLGENQFLTPGQNSPTALPATGDMLADY